jgi:hypothetical protein
MGDRFRHRPLLFFLVVEAAIGQLRPWASARRHLVSEQFVFALQRSAAALGVNESIEAVS